MRSVNATARTHIPRKLLLKSAQDARGEEIHGRIWTRINVAF